MAAAVAAVAEKAAGALFSCGGAHCRQLPGEKSFSGGCLKVAQAAAPSRTSVTLGSRVGGLHPAPLLLASRAAGCSTDLGQRAPWPGGQAAREAGRLLQGCLQQGCLQQGPLQQGRLQQGPLQQGRLQQGRLQQGSLQQGPLQQGRLSRWRGFGRKASSETPGLCH